MKDMMPCYFNDISISVIKNLLLQKGLEESKVRIRSQKSGQKDQNVDNQLGIQIIKNNNFIIFFRLYLFHFQFHQNGQFLIFVV